MIVGIGTKIPSGPTPFTSLLTIGLNSKIFLPTISKAWSKESRGNYITVPYQKLKLVKEFLKEMMKKHIEQIRDGEKAMKDAFNLQTQLDTSLW